MEAERRARVEREVRDLAVRDDVASEIAAPVRANQIGTTWGDAVRLVERETPMSRRGEQLADEGTGQDGCSGGACSAGVRSLAHGRIVTARGLSPRLCGVTLDEGSPAKRWEALMSSATSSTARSSSSSRPPSRGTVCGPDDDGYDEARRVHNGLIDRRPALIVRCRTAADVAAAVALRPRRPALEISVRGGGHNVAGRAVADGAVMIDLAEMKGVDVDPEPGPSPRRAA